MDVKERILQAYQELSNTRGLANVTVDEIASRAGISKRTLYRYFLGKEELIAASIDNFSLSISSEIDNILLCEDNPVEIFNKILSYIFINGQYIINPSSLSDLSRHYPHLWQKIDDFRRQKISSIINKIYGANAGYIDDVDLRILPAIILVSIKEILNPDFIIANNLRFEDAAQSLSKLLMAAYIKYPVQMTADKK